uniref:Transmembrane protein n=1 Tax=Schizaphis graminum TaxID=13262 RepID=A0A2S2P2V7_SCHGA
MYIFNCCLRSRVNSSILSSMKRSYTLHSRISIIHNNRTLLPINRLPGGLVPDRCFMKKMGEKPVYQVYNKKAAQDRVSPTEYELIYNGTGETYARCLSGMVIAAIIVLPSTFIGAYLYILITEGNIDLQTYLDIMLIPNSTLELMIMIPVLLLLKIVSYSFISKYVLRIYKHNTKRQYVGVYINPILPWKNLTCTFETAIKLPDSINVFIPWHKEYYRLAGHKSIILRERFKRPIDYDKMLGLD